MSKFREPADSGRLDREAAPTRVAENSHRLRSTEIFKGAREIVIEHGGEEYRLRRTSKGKLILTK